MFKYLFNFDSTRCIVMPMFIIAAKVCPPGAEATVFAMLTALSNFGAAVSSYFGATLLIIFGVGSGNYDNLKWLLIVKTCCRLSTLILIPVLVPMGCPNDTDVEENENEVWGATSDSIDDNSHSGHSLAAIGGICGSASASASSHGLLDSFHGKGGSWKDIDPFHSALKTHNPVVSAAGDEQNWGIQMHQRSQGAVVSSSGGGSEKNEVRTKIDSSRYFQYISPHENLTTQGV